MLHRTNILAIGEPSLVYLHLEGTVRMQIGIAKSSVKCFIPQSLSQDNSKRRFAPRFAAEKSGGGERCDASIIGRERRRFPTERRHPAAEAAVAFVVFRERATVALLRATCLKKRLKRTIIFFPRPLKSAIT